MKTRFIQIKKAFVLIPLLAISLWAFGIGQNQFFELNSKDSSFLFEKKDNKKTEFSSTNYEENEVILVEIEPESEIEIEPFNLGFFSFELVYLKKSNVQNHIEHYNSKKNKSIPLYDLFCNWKFHLS